MTRNVSPFIILLVLILAGCQTALTPAKTSQASPIPSRPFRTLTLSPTPRLTFTPRPSKTPVLSATPFPIFTVSPTSTLQPPLVEHTWQPETALTLLFHTRGDGGSIFLDSVQPSFALFADGGLFVKKYDESTGYSQIFTRLLSRQEICQHLNTLDQIGFLDYDPETYQFVGGHPSVAGGPGVQIEINAWKSHSHSYYEMSGYLKGTFDNVFGLDPNDPTGRPIILPALRDAYYFLTDYPTDQLEVYRPSQLLMRFADMGNSPDTVEVSKWPLSEPSLANLLERSALSSPDEWSRFVLLDGSEAQRVYEAIGRYSINLGYFYEEIDGARKNYYVLIHPLLPYESPKIENGDLAQIPAPGTEKPNFTLTCYPSDGILSIPTPANP
ncbi:MAG: hypothetical protein HY869_14295 [Chloroflexi bacterium]|nr:hypothetical protein [Chloroflexota bacterium]